MVEDLDDIIGKLNDQGGFGALLLDDTIKTKLVEYLHQDFGLPKLLIKSVLSVIYQLAKNVTNKAQSELNQSLQEKIKRHPKLAQALKWYFDELEKGINTREFLKDIKAGELNTANLAKIDAELQAIGVVYQQNKEILKLVGQVSTQLNDIVKKLKTMEKILPLRLEKPTQSDTKLQRFRYNSAFIPFIGRHEEQGILAQFVDSEPSFSWLSICEQGGAGKSRLAYHFCHNSVDPFWDKGFFHIDANTNTHDFSQWYPSVNTFIVIDYAGSYIQTVKSLLSYFDEKARTHQCKIRVLLLERNTKTPNNWYETLTSGSGNTLANFEHLISNTNILNLKPLSDEDNYAIAKQFINDSSKLPDLPTFSSKLKQIDTKKRTFFAAMLGDAIQQGNTSTSKEALFDEYYRRSYEHSWKNPPIDDAHYYFLGLTSIGVAINPKRLQSYQALDLFPKINDINQQFLQRLEINYNNEGYSNTAVDLMAEYFVLKHIISDDCSIIQTRNGKLWLNYIWQDLPEVAMVFTARCLLDFLELAQGLLDLEDPRYLNRIADVLLYLTATTGNKAKCYYDILEKLADKHQQQEIYITQAKALFNLAKYYGTEDLGKAEGYYDILEEFADKHQHQEIYITQAESLVNLVNDYGKTNPGKAKDYYDILKELVDKHQHQEIYITQAKALFNLVNSYNTTDHGKAEDYYDVLEKLADEHQHQEIYIEQAKALVNLVNDYGKTNPGKAKDYYDILKELADKHQHQEIYITQAKALINLVNDYGITDPGKAKGYYDILEKLADKHQRQEIYIEQAKALVNLVNVYGKTNLGKAKDYYDILKELADKHQHQEIYIEQAKALVNLVNDYGITDLGKAKGYYDILEKLADKHQRQEIYIEQAKALVNLVNYYGKTNPGKAKDYYDILKELADKHQHQEIYIEQAKALVNLGVGYSKTDLDKAKNCYDILGKLADKHQHQEIYITQATALFNLGVDYSKTDLDKAKNCYDILEKLADKHQHQGIYIIQATALFNLVGNYGKTDLDKAKDCYQVLAGLADRKKIEEINLMQLKILGYWSQEKLLPNSELGVLIEQYLQRWWGGKIQVSGELLKWLEGFTFVLITHYSTNKQDESDFNQAINNFTNGMEKIQYYLDKIHVISQQLITEEIL
jgi:N6-adenosine-specific RNA methylase IME4